MINKNGPVAVIDSGVGGVSVLRELTRQMPCENFIFFGDSANAPYGEKSAEEVRRLTFDLAERLLSMGAKALVVACNTATSAAVRLLREKYPQLPVVGIEPAIKPAVLYGERELGKADGSSTVLVMATPATIAQEKFGRLALEYEGRARIIPLPCHDLARLIERGDLDSPELKEHIKELLLPHKGVDSVVLGCTHYPFVRHLIEKNLPGTAIFDGAEGTAREALRRIEAAGLATDRKERGKIEFLSSKSGETAEMYERFLGIDQKNDCV